MRFGLFLLVGLPVFGLFGVFRVYGEDFEKIALVVQAARGRKLPGEAANVVVDDDGCGVFEANYHLGLSFSATGGRMGL